MDAFVFLYLSFVVMTEDTLFSMETLYFPLSVLYLNPANLLFAVYKLFLKLTRHKLGYFILTMKYITLVKSTKLLKMLVRYVQILTVLIKILLAPIPYSYVSGFLLGSGDTCKELLRTQKSTGPSFTFTGTVQICS